MARLDQSTRHAELIKSVCPSIDVLQTFDIPPVFKPPRSKMGAYFFCPVCHSVILFCPPLTLLISFEQ